MVGVGLGPSAMGNVAEGMGERGEAGEGATPPPSSPQGGALAHCASVFHPPPDEEEADEFRREKWGGTWRFCGVWAGGGSGGGDESGRAREKGGKGHAR